MELPTIMNTINKRLLSKVDQKKFDKGMKELYEAILSGSDRKEEDWSFVDFLKQVLSGELLVENIEDYFKEKKLPD